LALLILHILKSQGSMTVIRNCVVIFILIILKVASQFHFVYIYVNFLSVEWCEFKWSNVCYDSIFKEQPLV